MLDQVQVGGHGTVLKREGVDVEGVAELGTRGVDNLLHGRVGDSRLAEDGGHFVVLDKLDGAGDLLRGRLVFCVDRPDVLLLQPGVAAGTPGCR